MTAHGAQRGEGPADPGSESTPACCPPCVLGASSPGATSRKSSESWVRGALWAPRAGGHTAESGLSRLLAPPRAAAPSTSLPGLRATGTSSGQSPAQSPLRPPSVCPRPTWASLLQEPRRPGAPPRWPAPCPSAPSARQPVEKPLQRFIKPLVTLGAACAAAMLLSITRRRAPGRGRSNCPSRYKLPLPAGPFA